MLFLFRPRLVRRRTRLYQRPALYVLLALFLVDVVLTLRGRGRTVRVAVAEKDASDEARPRDLPSVFIVSVHRNTETILREAWNNAVLGLVDYLGPDNVYVSAVESGSQDYTKEALAHLQTGLDARGANYSIRLGATVWQQLDELYSWPDRDALPADRPGWIWHAEEDHFALRRIPYLARVRNQAMEPLRQLAAAGRRFDRVLWINDVAFDTADVLTLLDTHDGKFAAACAVDFKDYPQYYDTFALRDEQGNKAVSTYWPWFHTAAARADVRAGRPVRVQSCWNGMVAFDARPFYDPAPGSTHQKTALQFRGIDDSLAELHLEASECCLIHADNPLTEADASDDHYGVWLNPNVRVGYSAGVYRQVRRDVFPGPGAAVVGAWANRWDRAKSRIQYMLETQAVLKRLQQWRAATPEGQRLRTEAGVVCLINEMQIMWQNGWRHL